MAQSERFYFWRGYWQAMSKLRTYEERGEFVTAMCEWAFDGVEPDFADSPMLDFAWSIVSDQIRESVDIGIKQRERGALGGRPGKGKKTTAKTTALTTAKSGAKTTAKTTAESEGKGTERKSSDLPSSAYAESGGASAPAAGAARRAPSEHELIRIPPNAPARPEGY